MGATESHSTPKDCLPNLQWSLYEFMMWRERACEAGALDVIGSVPSTFGLGATVPPSMPTVGSVGGEGAGPTMMQTGTPATSPSRARETTVPTSFTYTAPPHDFAGDRAAMHDEHVSMERKADITTGHIGTSGMAPTEAIHARHLFDGGSLREKFVLILQYLGKLVHAAEENYMLVCNLHYMKRVIGKINTDLPNGLTMKSQAEKRMSENNTLLNNSLMDFDNARTAVHWLQKHFDLLIQRQMVVREMNDTQAEMHRIQTTSGVGDDISSEMKRLRERLWGAHKNLMDHMHKAMALRRESLVIGFKFLDANNSGSIEPRDMPNLSTEIFSRLDRRNKHLISAKDLLAGVDSMEKNIDTFNTRITESLKEINKLENDRQTWVSSHMADTNREKVRVKSEEMSVGITKKQADLWAVIGERDREEALLKETYTVFQQAFVDALFNKLGSCRIMPADKRKYSQLNCDLACIDKAGALGMTSTVPIASRGVEEAAAKPVVFGKGKMGEKSMAERDRDFDANEFAAMENLQRRLHAL